MFIQNALKVKNNIWRYALGILIIFIFTQIGTIPFVVAIFKKVGLDGAAKINPSSMMTVLENSNLTFFNSKLHRRQIGLEGFFALVMVQNLIYLGGYTKVYQLQQT